MPTAKPGIAPRVIVVGDVMVDLLASIDGPLRIGLDNPTSIIRALGGQAANTASWLAFAGAPTHVIGAVANDDNGRWIAHSLHAHGVSTHLAEREGRSGECFVVITPNGDRTMFPDTGANVEWDSDHFFSAFLDIASVDSQEGMAPHVHLSGYLIARRPEVAEDILRWLRADFPDTSTSFDMPALCLEAEDRAMFSRIMGRVNVVFANRDEYIQLCECEAEGPSALNCASPADVLASLRRLQPTTATLVLKDGAAGSWADDGDVPMFQAPFEATVTDTTGAGDAFVAGFLAAWTSAEDPDLAICLAAGSSTAARAIAVVGGVPPLSDAKGE